MGFISYPRTVAELKAILSLGYREVMRLLQSKQLRVNLRFYLEHLFKGNRYNDEAIDRFNEKLLDWQDKREMAGSPNAALVYHPSGVKILHGFKIVRVNYQRKANRTAYQKERTLEFNKARRAWLKEIANTHAKELEASGIPRSQIEKMKKNGKAPKDINGKVYQVHHRLPLDDGGTNDPKNFILIRDDIEHRAVHGYYNPGELRIDRIAYGGEAEVALPVPPKDTIVYPNPLLGYVAEAVPNVEFLRIYNEY